MIDFFLLLLQVASLPTSPAAPHIHAVSDFLIVILIVNQVYSSPDTNGYFFLSSKALEVHEGTADGREIYSGRF